MGSSGCTVTLRYAEIQIQMYLHGRVLLISIYCHCLQFRAQTRIDLWLINTRIRTVCACLCVCGVWIEISWREINKTYICIQLLLLPSRKLFHLPLFALQFPFDTISATFSTVPFGPEKLFVWPHQNCISMKHNSTKFEHRMYNNNNKYCNWKLATSKCT